MARPSKSTVDIWSKRQAELKSEAIEEIDHSIYIADQICESTIEKIAFMELQKLQRHFGSLNIEIIPQAEIEGFRVDFLIEFEPKFRKGEVKKLKIVVECDGHEWHEKTKEQATRDKSRDRAILLKGYLVMRFTGSEILRDPDDLFMNVGKAIIKWFKA